MYIAREFMANVETAISPRIAKITKRNGLANYQKVGIITADQVIYLEELLLKCIGFESPSLF
jgi:hypothetical protein